MLDLDCSGITGVCVKSIKWGEITIANVKLGVTQNYKDVILFWNGAKSWDWKLHDMRHSPGISLSALEELTGIPEITDVILSIGMEGVLEIPVETIAKAQQAGKKVHIAFTRDAVKIFNELVKEGKKVGALLHTTC